VDLSLRFDSMFGPGEICKILGDLVYPNLVRFRLDNVRTETHTGEKWLKNFLGNHRGLQHLHLQYIDLNIQAEKGEDEDDWNSILQFVCDNLAGLKSAWLGMLSEGLSVMAFIGDEYTFTAEEGDDVSGSLQAVLKTLERVDIDYIRTPLGDYPCPDDSLEEENEVEFPGIPKMHKLGEKMRKDPRYDADAR
jgi:hypothetical protein